MRHEKTDASICLMIAHIPSLKCSLNRHIKYCSVKESEKNNKKKTRFQISTYLEFSSPGATAPLLARNLQYSKGGLDDFDLSFG